MLNEIVRKPDPVLGHIVEQETEGEMILAEAALLEMEAATLDDGDDPASWVPEFYMRKHEEMKSLESRIKEQYKRMMSSIKARRAGLSWKFGPVMKSVVERMILNQGGKKKSVDLFNGKAGFRKKKATIKIVDEDAFNAWFDDQPADIQLDLITCFDRKIARKTPITDYCNSCGDIPDGIEYVDAHEGFYPDISVPQLPELDREVTA